MKFYISLFLQLMSLDGWISRLIYIKINTKKLQLFFLASPLQWKVQRSFFKLPGVKKQVEFVADSGMVTIISNSFSSKMLFRKQICKNFEKERKSLENEVKSKL